MTENNNLQRNTETNGINHSYIDPNMIIKIKTIDSNEYLIDIQKDAFVTELKSRIESVTQVPIVKQRLIFQGKLLQDKEKLSYYKISDLNVIHLVAKAGNNNSNNTEETRNTNMSDQPSSRGSGVLEYFGLLMDDTPNNIPDIISGFRERDNNSNISSNTQTTSNIPNIVRNRHPLINRRVRSNINSNNSNYDLKESKEVIKQNMLTIENYLDNSKKFNEINFNNTIGNTTNNENNNTANNIKLEFLDHKNRKLVKGQWVDVKDTINEWLEAQVTDVKDNRVYIHYNGWGTRWDEWIEMDSERIQPFRTHTLQNSLFNYLSPFPITKPDASVNLPDSVYPDFDEILKKLSKLFFY